MADAETGIRRILVAIDISADSVAALETSARLAAALGAELLGLFVEDLDVLRSTELPFAREIDVLSGRRRRLDARDLERQMRAQANRARRILERVANESRLQWSFRTARGRVSAELLASSAEADLVIVGAIGRSLRRAPGSTVRSLLERGSGPVVVVRQGARHGPRMHVLHDGSDVAGNALSLAARLLTTDEGDLTVVYTDQEAARRSGEEVREWTKARELDPRFAILSGGPGWKSELASLLRRERSGLVLVPRSAADSGAVRALLRRAPCPVLVVG